ncbi:FliO/MopB family protein [Caproiciproducens faecalis]|uniref:Flagellar biosynthetic protein FliO n=1 Tax=Caproiciproducens faecalis TaxID=2820301 RepID=A0ABS7DQM2_9FIRM|nr:flagellar biosynthetic protein FliO [Caproiciproducens faecalis]MBW7573362.1 flagellar biosynthetic protein FliO [Caproiciproducens faecalis]
MKFAFGTLPLLSFFSDILPLFFSLIAIVFVLYLCYVFSKFMANRVNNASRSGNIKIVERVALTQDKGLVIIEVCKRYYLVGFASNNIEILKELDEADLNISGSLQKDTFFDVLNSTLKSRWDVKMSDAIFRRADKTGDAEDKREEKK